MNAVTRSQLWKKIIMLLSFANGSLWLKVNSSIGHIPVPNKALVDVSYPMSLHRRARMIGGGIIAPALMAGQGDLVIVEYERI